jgi:hypothetical protein
MIVFFNRQAGTLDIDRTVTLYLADVDNLKENLGDCFALSHIVARVSNLDVNLMVI